MNKSKNESTLKNLHASGDFEEINVIELVNPDFKKDQISENEVIRFFGGEANFDSPPTQAGKKTFEQPERVVFESELKAQPVSGLEADVLQLIHKEHEETCELFFKFSNLAEDDQVSQKSCVKQISQNLNNLALIENDIFYPAVKKAAPKAADHVICSQEQHHTASFLIDELEDMEPSDDHFKAKVTVLGEMVKKHIKHEEKEVFEKARESSLDLLQLALEFSQRKSELTLGGLSKTGRSVALN